MAVVERTGRETGEDDVKPWNNGDQAKITVIEELIERHLPAFVSVIRRQLNNAKLRGEFIDAAINSQRFFILDGVIYCLGELIVRPS